MPVKNENLWLPLTFLYFSLTPAYWIFRTFRTIPPPFLSIYSSMLETGIYKLKVRHLVKADKAYTISASVCIKKIVLLKEFTKKMVSKILKDLTLVLPFSPQRKLWWNSNNSYVITKRVIKKRQKRKILLIIIQELSILPRPAPPPWNNF